MNFFQTAVSKYEATKQKRKFSSFFKSLVIELDKDLYGPDNHLVEVRHFGFDNHQPFNRGCAMFVCNSCWFVCTVAQNTHYSGDWRLSGEKAWRRGSALYCPPHARLPGKPTAMDGLWMYSRYISISDFLSAEKLANAMMHQKPEQ